MERPGDRADERTALDAMRAEFGQNLDELDLLIEAHGGHVRDLDSFFSSEPGDFDGMDQDSIAIAHTEAFTRVMTLDPATSTLDALKSSGRMRIIRDADLRSDLALWSTYFEDSREEAAGELERLRQVTASLLEKL